LNAGARPAVGRALNHQQRVFLGKAFGVVLGYVADSVIGMASSRAEATMPSFAPHALVAEPLTPPHREELQVVDERAANTCSLRHARDDPPPPRELTPRHARQKLTAQNGFKPWCSARYPSHLANMAAVFCGSCEAGPLQSRRSLHQWPNGPPRALCCGGAWPGRRSVHPAPVRGAC
jgi:hypothetical protein